MAKKFSFKLDKVLDYRAQLEDQAKAALAAAQAAHDTQQAKVHGLQSQLAKHMDNEEKSRKSTNDMWLWRQFKTALEQDIERERMELSRLELNLHQRRQEAVDRSRDKKLLEKLKQTQAKKHHEEQSAREEKENDEMATIRFQSQDF
ncbi:Flagellar export protein FliJ [Pseudodesulfovibrio profundus]|uniref:Flagellar FliJ protein n=1 Tax=Pseudodesulfovibrio profundus TaxID=57320 RepID=A0A2C8F9W2_9BACT|nr:flagellar export protein FliJ [Pseudodesulfovibrio profundus]MBC15950.1 flagellar export protein FliJ [Desulfovibrio sp.]SOB59435.1 Flagellar export protein FliJ [Pseudodesulfovibrio profundus]|tara:strand:- start:793 stop:1233 length:441 start_codon:yes stop_codon:yes gene_type:complete